jgi:hypothetical protein
MPPIRTTVTLDLDVAEQLKALAQRRNISFKVALNSTVRAGLAAERGGGRPFQVEPWPMHVRPGVDLTHALLLDADLEDEEVIRNRDLRK